MNATNSKAVREQAADVKARMKAITDLVQTEKRNLRDEEKTNFDSLDKDYEGLLATAETLERAERVNGLSRSESQETLRKETVSQPYSRGERQYAEERNKALAGWYLHKTPKSKAENWRAAERLGIDVDNPCMRFDFNKWESPMESRQQVIGTPTAGGDLVPLADNSLMKALDTALKFYGNVFQWATVVDTASGQPLPWPTLNDTANTAAVTAEDGSITKVDTTVGRNTLNAYKYSTLVAASWELIQDSAIDISEMLGKAMGVRFGRAINSDIIATGAGSGSGITPLTTAATLGATMAGHTAIVYADLVSAFHSIDVDYRSSPGTAWLFSDGFYQSLRGLVDGNGRPLVMSSLEGIGVDLPQSLMGKRFYLNQAVPAIGTVNHKCAFFGDLSKLIVRRVGGSEGGFNLVRLNETYALNGLTGFLGWMRTDALLSDAGTHPVKWLACSAS